MNTENNSPRNDDSDIGWEKDLVHKLAFAALKEQRKARRWSIFFKLAILLYITVLIFLFMSGNTANKAGIPSGDHTAIVELVGVIDSDSDASADVIISGMREAMKSSSSKALIIRANSPGGSPVQADYMYKEIQRLRAEYPDKPIYSVITDVCASACYYIISATDKIFANEASMVGSIGVLIDSFGFVGTMEKFGIERRLYTAGKNKGTLDPFSPEQPEDVAHINKMLDEVHLQFINAVKAGRGDRLKITDETFSGLFWTGERAKNMGLIDDFASSGKVARELVGEEELVDYTPSQDVLDRFFDRLGMSISSSFFTQIQPSLK